MGLEAMGRISIALAAACLPAMIGGCAAGEPGLPAREPYLTGTVTALAGNPPTARVEEIPGGLESGGAKAAARITSRTTITRNGRAVAPAELRVGQRVSLWFRGPVAESYPVQGEAAAISILSDS